jgi:hypothetical protein
MVRYFAPLLLLAAILTGCGGDYREAAIGAVSEVLVVVDSSKVNGPVGNALKSTLGRYIQTIPRPEPRYDLVFRTILTNEDVKQHQKHKNLVLVSHLQDSSNVGKYVNSLLSDAIKTRIMNGEQFMFPLKDRWYRDQWITIFMARNEAELADVILDHEEPVLQSLYAVELPRHEFDVYRRGEQVELGDSLFDEKGFSFRIQHDYKRGVDTTDFVTFRRFLQDNDRWISVHWMENVTSLDHVTTPWINTKRDSLNQIYFRGTREDAYVTTDYRRALSSRLINLNGRRAYELRGIWVMSDQSMGGPFVSYVIYDEPQKRLYFMEYGQFSPKYKQRRFVYQFDVMARSFRTTPLTAP